MGPSKELTEYKQEGWIKECIKRSADSITAEFQAFFGIDISTKTLCQGMDSHGQAAACMPYTTKHDVMCQKVLCEAHLHWSPEQRKPVSRLTLVYLTVW